MTYQKRELFEILAESRSNINARKKASIAQTVSPSATGRMKPVPPDGAEPAPDGTTPTTVAAETSAAPRPDTEAAPGMISRMTREGVTFHIQTAAGFLAVFMILLVTAFLLGFRRGEIEASARAPGDGVVNGTLSGESTVTERRQAVPPIPSTSFVVRISTYSRTEHNRLKAEEDIKYALADEEVQRQHLTLFLFEHDAAYAVGIGVFAKQATTDIADIIARFKTLPGPRTTVTARPYEAAAAIQVDKLGKAVSRYEG
mgnify:CR=1 FL=1